MINHTTFRLLDFACLISIDFSKVTVCRGLKLQPVFHKRISYNWLGLHHCFTRRAQTTLRQLGNSILWHAGLTIKGRMTHSFACVKHHLKINNWCNATLKWTSAFWEYGLFLSLLHDVQNNLTTCRWFFFENIGHRLCFCNELLTIRPLTMLLTNIYQNVLLPEFKNRWPVVSKS